MREIAAAKIGRWRYSEPVFEENENEDTVVFTKFTLPPARFYEYGIDADKTPYEKYAECDEAYRTVREYKKSITKEDLIKQTENAAAALKRHGYDGYEQKYLFAVKRLKLILHT